MRKQGGGRIIQISSYGGQVAFTSNSMYYATKFGIEGFCESVSCHEFLNMLDPTKGLAVGDPVKMA